MSIVGTLIVGSPERQVVRTLIVRFPKHQQRNVNPNCMTSWALAARCKPAKKGIQAIKFAKNVEREKRIGAVGIAYLPLVGDLSDL